jgi:hypothetical protein
MEKVFLGLCALLSTTLLVGDPTRKIVTLTRARTAITEAEKSDLISYGCVAAFYYLSVFCFYRIICPIVAVLAMIYARGEMEAHIVVLLVLFLHWWNMPVSYFTHRYGDRVRLLSRFLLVGIPTVYLWYLFFLTL